MTDQKPAESPNMSRTGVTLDEIKRSLAQQVRKDKDGNIIYARDTRTLTVAQMDALVALAERA